VKENKKSVKIFNFDMEFSNLIIFEQTYVEGYPYTVIPFSCDVYLHITPIAHRMGYEEETRLRLNHNSNIINI
jgi:hypothetical protein